MRRIASPLLTKGDSEAIGSVSVKTLRVTPAMEAGLANHVWNLEEIASLAQ
jgi:hypothetical protein